MKWISWLSITFCFSPLITCIGQNSGYRIINYNTDNGLPQNSVKDIKIDKAGYCWLSTEMGLVRFDGKKFRTFNSNDIPGLHTDRIQLLFYTAEGSLIAKGENRQLVEVHQNFKNEAPFPRIKKDQNTIPVHAGYRDSDKISDSLIKQLDRKNNSVNFSYIYATNNGKYVTVRDTLFYIHNGQISTVDNIYQKEYERISLVEDILLLMRSPKNLVAWHRGKVLPITRLEGDINEEVMSKEDMLRVMWSSTGTYLYTGKNIYRLYIKNETIHSQLVIKNIEIRGITTIHYLEKENKYLIGSNTQGFFIVQPSVFTYPFVPDHIYDNSFYTQLKLADNLFLTRNICYNTKGSYTSYPLNIKPNRSVYLSEKGFIYTDVDYNLSRYNIQTQKNDSLFTLDSRLRAIFPGNKTTEIYFCTRYFFGTLTQKNGVQVKKLPGTVSVTTGLQLTDDLFLLGTNMGLKWYSYSANSFTHHILDSVNIWSLHKDRENNIWIGSYGKVFFYTGTAFYLLSLLDQGSL